MNNKFFNKKYRQMNAHLKTKTSFRSKFSALGALLLVLNFATAWGQNIEMTNGTNNGTTNMNCGTTYTLTLSNQNNNRTYTFKNTNGSIHVDKFTYTAFRKSNRNSSTAMTYDYLEIIVNGVSTNYGNTTNNTDEWERCHNPNNNSNDLYLKDIVIESIDVPSVSGTATIVFKFHNGVTATNASCDGPKFTATIKPICCPTLTEPADGAVVEASGPVTLTWEAMSGVTSYDVYVNNVRVDQNVQNTSYQYSGLVDGTTYTWKIVPAGANAANYSHCSPYTFKACSGISCATNLQPADGTVLTNRLISWNAVECASSYEVFVTPTSVPVTQMYAKNADDTYKYLVAEPTSSQYHLPILAEGEYRWVVRPKNAAGQVAEGCETHTFRIQYQSSNNYAVTPSTQGREFFFSLMENGYDHAEGEKYTAIIAPKENATVTFHYYADPNNTTNQTLTYSVTAGTTKEIELSSDLVYHPNVGDQYKNRTVRVTSTADISLYIANEANNSFDASIVLPSTALGTDYRIQTFPSGDITENYGNDYTSYACFMIVATKENTRVKIEGANGINPSAPEVLLQEGESYFVRKNSYTNNDLSGIRVYVSPRDGHPEDECKTIAVFNGSTVTGVPTSMTKNYDHLVEQAYPISNWGTKFAITSTDGYIPYTNDADADYIRITAAESTYLTFGGTVYPESGNNSITTDNLTAGQTKTYRLHRTEGSCYIETVKPVACYLYQRSASQLGNNDNMGDPSMVWIAPIERGIEEITFSTFAATGINNTNHWVNIVIPIEAISGGQAVMLKRPNSTEENIRSSFMTGENYNYVAGSGDKYAYARVKINHGTYTLRSIGKGKMVIHVYGLGNVRGYAYAAGSEAVPYKSNFLVGDANGGIIDIATLQDPDFHFCSGSEYTFMINSNSPNVDSVKIDFDDGSPIKTINLTVGETSVKHTMPNPGPYEITAQVYYTIYNNELCQEEVIVETVRDYVFIFFNEAETIRDTVCKGTNYTFTRKYWVSDADSGLVQREYTKTFQNVTEQQTATVTGYSEYGCKMNITFILDVYSEITAGEIISNTIECMSNGENIGLSVVQLQNSVSATSNDPNAHYQWQKSDTESGPWEDITNQTGESYIVTENGYYRRAYIAACSTAYSNVLQAEASGAFNPGAPIDNTVRICSNETLPPTTLGVLPTNARYDRDRNMVLIGAADYVVEFQWQQSTDGGATWDNIDGATSYNYTIPTSSYTQSTSFRRLITNVGPCTINLSSGNYHVVVKPTFEYEKTIVKGCPGENNASVEFTITGGSGIYRVYYTETAGSTTVDYPATSLGDGKYIFRNLTNSGSASYAFTIEDEIHRCTKTETITIYEPTPLRIGYADDVAGCQGATINIDIPAISGGTGEGTYRIEVESSVLNINEEVTADPYSATIPGGAAAGTHTVIYKVLDAAGCYKTSTQNVLTIYANPVLELSKTNISDCQNPNGTITATVTNAPTNGTYMYTKNTDAAVSGTTSKQFTGLKHGNYTIKVEDNNHCIATGSVTIEDNLDLTIATSVTDMVGNSILTDGFNVICPKTQYKVNVTQVNGANTPVLNGETSQSLYEYSFDGGNTFSTNYSYTTISPNTCDDQNINVVVMEMSSHCKDEQNVQVIVQDLEDPEMAPTLTAIEKEVYFCTQYTFDIADYAQTILNATNDKCAANADLQVTTSPSMQWITLSVYNDDNSIKTTDVTFTVTDLCGNDSERKITITPKPWPNFKINGTATDGTDNNCYCHGDNIVLTAVLEDGTDIEDTYDGAKSYRWYKDGSSEPITDGGRYSGATTNELKISSAVDGDAGEYTLVIIDKNDCPKEATITICVHQAIEFNLE